MLWVAAVDQGYHCATFDLLLRSLSSRNTNAYELTQNSLRTLVRTYRPREKDSQGDHGITPCVYLFREVEVCEILLPIFVPTVAAIGGGLLQPSARFAVEQAAHLPGYRGSQLPVAESPTCTCRMSCHQAGQSSRTLNRCKRPPRSR